MSRIIYTGAPGNPHWSTNQPMFTLARAQLGALAVRQIANFGASSASAVLGPDLAMPGQQGNNVPTAVGAPWNQLLIGGPPLSFVQDQTYPWIRGHLINGRWGGPGNNWQNLVPLTGVGNANHATVEGYIDGFIAACYQYELGGQRPSWYGVYYCVQASVSPFSDPTMTNAQNLYSYAPEFIRVSWRAVSIVKPVNVSTGNAAGNINNYAVNAVPAFPMGFVLPQLPAVMNGTQVLPAAGNVAGGAVLGALPPGFPAAQANGFDGWIEIHQS
ncbi:hypothetical protein [Lysobacter enzymogenes]|uniref:hypothetical protein n=1 Tax=Lysobacter enzymogenes TaxID=69 RepID=UPI00089A7FE7|nr:hypothetical protein [Lysobacter enzymogenes]SDW17065.1 hypothetical protein SAMN05421681_101305 [Lysobacter enzymogenes]